MMDKVKKVALAAGAVYLANMVLKPDTLAKIPVVGSKPDIARALADGGAVVLVLSLLG